MKSISEAIATLQASPVREMYDLASKAENLLDFTLGEPDFATPERIKEAAKKALDADCTHYTHNAGMLELREAISCYAKKNCRIASNPETEVFVGAGATEVLSLVIKTLVSQGEEVIVQTPMWPTLVGQIHICGGRAVPVEVREENGFVLKAEDIEKKISSKTKLIIVNTPHNPTGAVIPREEQLKIAELAENYDLYVIADEVYHRFVYDGIEHFSLASQEKYKKRVITIGSFSKTYAMTGWRLGWGIAEAGLVERITKLQEFYSSCTNTFAQYGAIEALRGDQGVVEWMKDEYDKRRRLVTEAIYSMKNLSCPQPAGAFYAFINIKEIDRDSMAFCKRLLKRTGVALAPGVGFGKEGDGYVRLCYANSVEKLKDGLERLSVFCQYQ